MEDTLRSRALEVRDRRAADAMTRPWQRHLVLSLIGREASISELVAESRQSMGSVHYHVNRLHRLGLLKVAGRTARAGRAIMRYTAAADVFYVPAALAAAGPGAILERELQEALGNVQHDTEGTLFYRDSRGGMSMREVRSRRPHAGVAANTWRILDLDAREAAELAAAIRKLLDQATLKPRHRRQQKYIVRCAILRRDNDDLFTA